MRREMLLAGMVIVALTLSAAQAAAPVSFTRQAGDFVADAGSEGVAAADFDGDGKMDLVVSNDDADDVSVLWGNGSGGFLDSGAPISVGIAPFAVAVGDFNNDGKLDIATSDEIGNTVTVLLNQGNRAFAPAVSTDTGGSPQALVVADFNGDHFADVATANDFDGTVTILFGIGDGTLFIAQTVTVGDEPVGLALGDLDGDGLPDMVVTNSSGGADGNGTVSVLKGVAGGMFEAQPEIALPASCGTPGCVPVAVAIADLNGDHKPDAIVANNEGDSVTVLLNTGNLANHCSVSTAKACSVDADCPQGETCLPLLAPSSTLSNSFSVAPSPEWVVAADFDGDGRMDIATSSDFDDKVSVLVGNGDGTFMLPSVDFDVGAAPYGIVAAALNGDSKPDIASANAEDGTASVLINTTGAGQACGGDCNGDGEVTVNELITMVNIALGTADVSTCLAGDADSSGGITINEIIAAVNNALNGCAK